MKAQGGFAIDAEIRRPEAFLHGDIPLIHRRGRFH
jgi:hypothetical protein